MFQHDFQLNYDIKCAIQERRIVVKHASAQNIPVQESVLATDYRLRHGDLVLHYSHRHEPPVSAEPVVVIYESEDVVVVSKPPSIPVHPCANYRRNTLSYILQHDLQKKQKLHITHRLDKLTSGRELLQVSLCDLPDQ